MLSLPQLKDAAAAAGIPEQAGFPLRSVIAAIAVEESEGDAMTLVLGDKDPVKYPKGPAVGLLQLEEGVHPVAAAKIRAIIANPLYDERTKAVAQIRAARDVIADALQTTAIAMRLLVAHGHPIDVDTLAIIMDASWQHAPSTVIAWARSTPTGDPREIDPRAPDFLRKYRELNPPSPIDGFLALFGIIGAVTLGLWIIDQMGDS